MYCIATFLIHLFMVELTALYFHSNQSVGVVGKDNAEGAGSVKSDTV